MSAATPGPLALWIGHVARPFCLIAASSSAAFATVTIPFRPGMTLTEGAIYITAAWASVAALYGAKALEERGKAASYAEMRVGIDGGVKGG